MHALFPERQTLKSNHPLHDNFSGLNWRESLHLFLSETLSGKLNRYLTVYIMLNMLSLYPEKAPS
jgi:hypothetical protein